MDTLWLKIAGSVAFVVAMIFYVRYAWRKGERDYEYMVKSNAEHAEWMVDTGRHREQYEQRKRDSDKNESWIIC